MEGLIYSHCILQSSYKNREELNMADITYILVYKDGEEACQAD